MSLGRWPTDPVQKSLYVTGKGVTSTPTRIRANRGTNITTRGGKRTIQPKTQAKDLDSKVPFTAHTPFSPLVTLG